MPARTGAVKPGAGRVACALPPTFATDGGAAYFLTTFTNYLILIDAHVLLGVYTYKMTTI